MTALTPVARGMAWVALADGSIVEVEAAETEEACAKVVRTFRDSGQRAGVESDARETNGGDGAGRREGQSQVARQRDAPLWPYRLGVDFGRQPRDVER